MLVTKKPSNARGRPWKKPRPPFFSDELVQTTASQNAGNSSTAPVEFGMQGKRPVTVTQIFEPSCDVAIPFRRASPMRSRAILRTATVLARGG
jgi:S1-C subfamily serine protease